MIKSIKSFFARMGKGNLHMGFLADVEVPAKFRVIYMSADEPTRREMERLWKIDKEARELARKVDH